MPDCHLMFPAESRLQSDRRGIGTREQLEMSTGSTVLPASFMRNAGMHLMVRPLLFIPDDISGKGNKRRYFMDRPGCKAVDFGKPGLYLRYSAASHVVKDCGPESFSPAEIPDAACDSTSSAHSMFRHILCNP